MAENKNKNSGGGEGFGPVSEGAGRDPGHLGRRLEGGGRRAWRTVERGDRKVTGGVEAGASATPQWTITRRGSRK